MKGFVKTFSMLAFGVALPVAALVYELLTRQCAMIFFDPLPTFAHVGLVAAVPLVNLSVWWGLRRGQEERYWRLSQLNAVVIGIALFYSVLFIPLVPIGVVGVIVLIGLLPLAPLAALTVALFLRRALSRAGRAGGLPRVRGRIGIACAIALLIGLQLPAVVTQIGLQMATSTDPVEHGRGIRILRFAGDETALLRACYVRRGQMADVFSVVMSGHRNVSTDEARNIFYRVTGKPFNSVAPPAFIGEFNSDRDIGGAVVGQRSGGLVLRNSAMRARVHPDAALAYLEWTIEVENTSERIGEGRLQMTLPPGAVVSRVTLWINGEEREAAFGTSAVVREAYEKVVSRQRDPLLVTLAGPDSVLAQLFPVPPRGGSMRFRLGMTVPLNLVSRGGAELTLPRIEERNIAIPDAFGHGLNVTSTSALSVNGAGLGTTVTADGVHVVAGTVEEPASVVIAASRDSGVRATLARDDLSESPGVVVQRVVPVDERYREVVVVIDGSRSMREHVDAIVEAVDNVPAELPLTVFFAGDSVRQSRVENASSQREFALSIAGEAFAGGMDNGDALQRAMTFAAGRGGVAVLWIHGAQAIPSRTVPDPAAFASADGSIVPLYSVQVSPGQNELKRALARYPEIRPVAVTGDLSTTLDRLFSTWSGKRSGYRFERTHETVAPPASKPLAREAGSHVARLWAYDSVRDLASAIDRSGDAAAAALGIRYQLVTAVTGAVVLEAASQYDEAGLQPADAANVPTVPEPEVMGLLFIVVLVLGYFARRTRHPLWRS